MKVKSYREEQAQNRLHADLDNLVTAIMSETKADAYTVCVDLSALFRSAGWVKRLIKEMEVSG
jgi:hypothetical protein